ncbi:helix-turn-helix domain-containing protein [Streptomyces sparsogenes]|uniref:helix-turn-helix domain-containing protein n=1 Tax=Streptomyces sparsogenes TaxID=67365 RepID=UPI0033209969
MAALDKAAAILDVLDDSSASLSQISAATGIPRGTVGRLVRAMTSIGLVTRREDGRIAPGPRIARLAAAAAAASKATAEATLAALRDATGTSAVRLFRRCGPAGTARVCIAEVLDPQAPEQSQLGVPSPLHPDAITQTLFAWQRPTDEVGRAPRGTVPYTANVLGWTRRRGWTHSLSGPDQRVATVAAPVLHRPRQQLVGVLAISGPTAVLKKNAGQVHGRALIKAASVSEVITECMYSSGAPVTAMQRGTV